MPNTDQETSRSNRNNSGVYVTRRQLLNLRRTAKLALSQPTMPVNTGQLGESPSRKRGHGIEFEEVRPYQPGDEIRHIDWRVTARTGKPHTRQYSEQQHRDVLVAVDQRSNMFFGSSACFKSWLAAVVSAQIGWSVMLHNGRLSAVVAAHDVRQVNASSAQSAMFSFIDLMVEANNSLAATDSTSIPLLELLSEVFMSTTNGCHVFIASDFRDLDDDSASILNGIGNKCAVTLLWIVDPFEETLPAAGWVGISNGTDRECRRLNRSTRSRYRQQGKLFEQKLREYANSASAELNKLSTNDFASSMLADPSDYD